MTIGKQHRLLTIMGALFASLLCAIAISAPAYAFELSSDENANNHGFDVSITETGSLTVTVATDDAFQQSFSEGETLDDTLTIPASINGIEVKTLEFTTRKGKKNFFSNTLIKNLVLPRTLTEFPSMNLSNVGDSNVKGLVGLEEISFLGDGDLKFTAMGSTSALANGETYSNLPTTLRRFNAQTIVVDGKAVEYSCVIPDSVTNLKRYAFQNTSIESVFIPDTVIEWDSSAFSGCNSLKRATSYSTLWPSVPQTVDIIEVLGTVTSVPESAFAGNEKIEEIELPASVESIGAKAFSDCVALKSVSIPDGVTEINDETFKGCSSLLGVSIPDGVTSIGARAFAGCASLESVVFGDTEALTTIKSGAFKGAGLKTLCIPDSVSFIGSGAFSNSSIESIVFPKNLWEGMSLNSDFNKDPSGVDLKDTTGQTDHWAYGAQMFVSNGMQYLLDSNLWNTSLKSVDLSNYSQSFIPYYMFAGCSALEEVRIPSVVELLAEGAFADCTSLKRVYLYGANVEVAGSSSSGDTGDGSGGAGEGGWVEHYPSVFGYHVYAGSGVQPSVVDGKNTADSYAVNTDMVLYGIGFEQNELLAYAEKYNCAFIPFAFLGEGGKSDVVKSLFGYEMPANEISATDVEVGEVPEFTLSYQDEGIARTLVPGTDCTVTYTDYKGNPIDALSHDGMFTATIVGDEDSVWGTAEVQVKVGTGINPEQAAAADKAKAGLQKAIEEARALDTSKLTADQKAALEDAIKAAEEALASDAPTADALNAALTAMSAAAKTATEQIEAAGKAQAAPAGSKAKAANPMTVKAKTIKAKAKKKTVVKKAKAFAVRNAKGKVTFRKLSGSKKVKVSASGKVIVKKGLKKGKTYKVKVRVRAAGNASYKAASKTVTLKVKVK